MEFTNDNIKDFFGEDKFVEIFKADEDVTIIGQISMFLIDGQISYYEYHNNQMSDSFRNTKKSYKLNKNDSVRLLTEDEINEFHRRLDNANLYYKKYRLHLKDNELQFKFGDYIQDKEDKNVIHKITCVRFPKNINEPIMYHSLPINSCDMFYSSIASQEVIETCYNKIDHLPNDFFQPFQKVLFANSETNGLISCGFYNQKYIITDDQPPYDIIFSTQGHLIIGSQKRVDFCLPYNFETKEYIGKHKSRIVLDNFYY